MKKQILALCAFAMVNSFTAYGLSENAQAIKEGLALQGMDFDRAVKNAQGLGKAMSFTALFGNKGETGVTCVKRYDSNQAQCSLFERSAEGLDNFQALTEDESSAWYELFWDWHLSQD